MLSSSYEGDVRAVGGANAVVRVGAAQTMTPAPVSAIALAPGGEWVFVGTATGDRLLFNASTLRDPVVLPPPSAHAEPALGASIAAGLCSKTLTYLSLSPVTCAIFASALACVFRPLLQSREIVPDTFLSFVCASFVPLSCRVRATRHEEAVRNSHSSSSMAGLRA